VLLRASHTLDPDARALDALAAFRPALQADVAAGVALRHCFPPHSSFCGFHIADIPFKIWRRVGWRPPPADRPPDTIAVPYAPFGGLFLHSTLLERIGAPDEALVLYADDTEFSHRIVRSGGHIWLLTAAEEQELESSWSSKTAVRSSFERWLQRGSDLQVFYGARNRAHFERHTWIRSKPLYFINRWTYLSLLRLIAGRCHRFERYALFRRAIELGERGRLGPSEDFPLS
jgi:GT2 family glycosyltransferase